MLFPFNRRQNLFDIVEACDEPRPQVKAGRSKGDPPLGPVE
jgi:hypothetical protein